MKCEKCGATDCKDLARQVQELTAELQEQCKLVGKDIDRCDKLVMEKRAVEVKRDRFAAQIAALVEAGDALSDSLVCLLTEHPSMSLRRAKDDPHIAAWRKAKGESGE